MSKVVFVFPGETNLSGVRRELEEDNFQVVHDPNYNLARSSFDDYQVVVISTTTLEKLASQGVDNPIRAFVKRRGIASWPLIVAYVTTYKLTALVENWIKSAEGLITYGASPADLRYTLRQLCA